MSVLKRKLKPRGSIIAALDVGTSKIACFIGRVVDDEGTIEVMGMSQHASRGVKNGTIIDLDAAEAGIRHAVHSAENMASGALQGYPLRDVVVNLSGLHAQSHATTMQVNIQGHAVGDSDVRRALSKAQELELGETDQELIHTIPVGYRIDGNQGIREPRGMFGQMLEVGIHMVTGSPGAIRNLSNCISRSHLDISALCVAPYAAGLSSLVEDEMDLGCTVIDMGGGVTSLAVFQGGAMIYTAALPVGGYHVTSDIARGLTTSMVNAERLKTLYGSAIATTADETELIDVPPIGEDDPAQPNHVPRSLLVGIIQPRLEETFELVRARLQDSGLGPDIGRRVVLTGGASQLPGLRDLAQSVLDKQVRLGRPLRLSGVADSMSGPAFSVAAGLLTYVSSHADEMPAEIMTQVHTGSLSDRVIRWFKENW